MADGSERVARAFAPSGAEDDRVVLRELLTDHARGIARSRDEPLDTFVVRALAEELVERRAPLAAAGLRDVQQRDRPVLRPRELDPEPSGELRVATAADRDEDPPSPGRRALHHCDVGRWIAKDRLDRGAEQIPPGPPPADEQKVGPLAGARIADGVPPDPGDCNERSDVASGEIRRERVEGPPAAARLGLCGRERVLARHLDDRGENDLAAAGESGRGLDERALTLGLGDRDEHFHGRSIWARSPSTSGSTCSSSTRGHESARTRERKRAPGSSRARSTASAIASPEASGLT